MKITDLTAMIISSCIITITAISASVLSTILFMQAGFSFATQTVLYTVIVGYYLTLLLILLNITLMEKPKQLELDL
jgi:hypothetical protein